jgi:hypothetical protein
MGGTVTLSIEVELAWGFHDRPPTVDRYAALSDDRSRETTALSRILERCDVLDIPITFDVVGHLFEEQCPGRHDGPHESGWFDADPGTDRSVNPLFYAPDLVEAIDSAAVDHEIATHTYSHVICNKIPDAVLDWELTTVSSVHEAFDIARPTSIIPPRHREPSRSVLRDHDVQITRKTDPRTVPPTGRIGRFNWAFRRPPIIRTPRQTDGVVETYCSHYPSLTATHLPAGQRDPHPVFAVLPTRVRQRLHARYLTRHLDEAMTQDGHVHLWTHLFNLSNESQWSPVRSFLETLAQYRDDGDVTVARMNELPAYASTNDD